MLYDYLKFYKYIISLDGLTIFLWLVKTNIILRVNFVYDHWGWLSVNRILSYPLGIINYCLIDLQDVFLPMLGFSLFSQQRISKIITEFIAKNKIK